MSTLGRFVWLARGSSRIKAKNGNSVQPQWSFLKSNGDKLLVIVVLFTFYFGSWYAYRHGLGGFGDASIDLTKQLVAAFLTLTVSSRVPWKSNGGANGPTPTNPTNGSSTGASGSGASSVQKVPGTSG